jgi:MFS family permease
MSSATTRESKNRRLASLGATLEYYDFVAYIYVAAAISEAFFPSDGSETLHLVQTFGIYAVGFFARPVAGIALSHLADRVGRKRVFLFTLALMSAATFGIGVLPTYDQVGWFAPALLLLMRLLQGCAVGGELPAAAVFVTEFSGPARIGFSGAYLQSMAYGGFLLGSGAALLSDLIATHVLPGTPSLNWRLPFVLGGLLGLLALYLRRQLDETPAFEEMQQTAGVLADRTSISAIFRSQSTAILIGFLAVGALTGLNVVFFQYWPTYLQVDFGHSADLALASSLLSIVAAMLAMPWWGRYADRFGWRSLYVTGAALSAATSIAVFAVLPRLAAGSALVLVLPIPAALSVASIVAAGPGLLCSLFPTHIRQACYAIPYNVGAALFGGLLPLSIAPMVASVGVRAPLIILGAGCLLALVVAAVIPRLPMYLGRTENDPRSAELHDAMSDSPA